VGPWCRHDSVMGGEGGGRLLVDRLNKNVSVSQSCRPAHVFHAICTAHQLFLHPIVYIIVCWGMGASAPLAHLYTVYVTELVNCATLVFTFFYSEN